MRKICTWLYFFLQCAIYVQDCTFFLNVQYMCKIFRIRFLYVGFSNILTWNLYHCNGKSNQMKGFIFETWEVEENRSNRGKKYTLAHILHIEEWSAILCTSCATLGQSLRVTEVQLNLNISSTVLTQISHQLEQFAASLKLDLHLY